MGWPAHAGGSGMNPNHSSAFALTAHEGEKCLETIKKNGQRTENMNKIKKLKKGVAMIKYKDMQ